MRIQRDINFIRIRFERIDEQIAELKADISRIDKILVWLTENES